jgi:dipeptidyl aminopeptidase/acylaminoacyl peptidase
VDDAALAPDGRLLAYALNCDGAVEVIVRDLRTGGERRVEGLPHGALYDYWQPGLAWNSSSTQLAISWSASRHPPNVWIYDARSGRAWQATQMPQSGVEPPLLSEPEHVTYPTFDGRQIPALYFPSKEENRCAPPPGAPPLYCPFLL